MTFLTVIAWVFGMTGAFLITTVVFAFIGIPLLALAGVLSAVGSSVGE
jgi:hypothetical protein